MAVYEMALEVGGRGETNKQKGGMGKKNNQ